MLGVGLFFVNCSDQTGPEERFGQLALIPTFESSAAYIVPVDSLRITLTRSDSTTLALDTVIGIAGQDSVDLQITVTLLAQTETFFLVLKIVNSVGDTVFSAGPDLVTATSGGSTATPTPVTIVYVGVGSDADSVRITTQAASVLFGDTVLLDAIALDSLGAPIPGTPIRWLSTDEVRGTFPDDEIGRLVGGGTRGSLFVVAELLTGPVDTATVLVQPTPSSVVIVSGNDQSGNVQTELVNPIVVQVNGSDGIGVQRVSVAFSTPDGGTLTPDTVITDAQGQAASAWVLGSSAGPQTATTEVVGAAGVQATINATAIQLPPTDIALASGDAQRATVATNLAQPLSVIVTDASGNPVGGVTVTWAVTGGGGSLTQPTTVTDGAGIASNQFQVGPATGGNTVEASVTGLIGSPIVFSALATPAGMTKLWDGVTTDWATASNWNPVGVPTATDNVFVPASAASQPVLGANHSVGDLALEVGANLDVSTFTLTASGDVGAGTTITGTGTVALTGTGTTLAGSLPNVTVSSDVTVVGPITVTGNLTVSGASANLILNGFTVAVTGNVTTQTSGILTMASPTDALTVTGDATFNGGTSTLSAGQITLQGDFSQSGTAQSFAPTGTHTTLFNGTLAQTILFNNPGPTSSRFQDLEVTNIGGAILATNTQVNGTVTVGGTGNLALNGNSVTVSGTFSTTSSGVLTMTNPLDVLDVAGAVTLGGASTSGTLTNGTLNVQGDFTQTGGVALRYAPSGTHKTVFNGTTPQTITFGNPGATSSRFQDIDITNATGVSFISTAQVNGFLNNTGTLDVQTGTLTLSGTFAHPSGAVLQGLGTLDVSGATILPTGTLVGTVNPGTSPGILNIVGNFPQDALATVNIEVGGNVAGVNYDQLNVSGTATMSGKFGVGTLLGYAPTSANFGDSLNILTFASRPVPFGTLSIPDLAYGIALDTVSTATSFDLVVKPQILFVGDTLFSGTMTYYRINPSGLNRQINSAEGVQGDNYPRWNHDRTRIAYSASPGLAPNQLHVALANGLGVAHLTSPTDTSTRRPRYNSTGQRLAFECGDGVLPDDVCVIADVSGAIGTLIAIGDDLGGGKEYVTDRVTSRPLEGAAAFAWDPSNPDRLAMVRDSNIGAVAPNFASRIYTISFDGTALATLSNTVMQVGNGVLQIVGTMDWSPNGLTLAFTALDDTGAENIYVIGSDGLGLTQITASTNREFRPIFSPDSREIMFAREVGGVDIRYAIYDVATATQRVEIPSTITVDGGDALIGYDWSPDGSQIVLVDENSAFSIMIYVLPNNFTNYLTDRVAIARPQDAAAVTDMQPSWRR